MIAIVVSGFFDDISGGSWPLLVIPVVMVPLLRSVVVEDIRCLW